MVVREGRMLERWRPQKGALQISSDGRLELESSGLRNLSTYSRSCQFEATSALKLSNVAGVFYILVGGLILSLTLASVEYLCACRKFRRRSRTLRRRELSSMEVFQQMSTGSSETLWRRRGLGDLGEGSGGGKEKNVVNVLFITGMPCPPVGSALDGGDWSAWEGCADVWLRRG